MIKVEMIRNVRRKRGIMVRPIYESSSICVQEGKVNADDLSREHVTAVFDNRQGKKQEGENSMSNRNSSFGGNQTNNPFESDRDRITDITAIVIVVTFGPFLALSRGFRSEWPKQAQGDVTLREIQYQQWWSSQRRFCVIITRKAIIALTKPRLAHKKHHRRVLEPRSFTSCLFKPRIRPKDSHIMLTRSTLTTGARLNAARSVRTVSFWSQVPQG